MKKIITFLVIIGISFNLMGCSSKTSEEQFVENVKKSFVAKIKYYEELKNNNSPSEKYKIAYIHKIDKQNVGKRSDYNFTDKKIKAAANLYFKGMKNNDFIESKSYIIESIYQIKNYVGFNVGDDYKKEVRAIKKAENFAYKICYIASWIDKIEQKTYAFDTLNDGMNNNDLYYYGLNIKNSTPFTINNLEFRYTFYNENSSTIFQSTKDVAELKKHDDSNILLKYNKNMGEFKYVKIKVTHYYQYTKDGIWLAYNKTEGR